MTMKLLDAVILICCRKGENPDAYFCRAKKPIKTLFMFSNLIACKTESILIILAGKEVSGVEEAYCRNGNPALNSYSCKPDSSHCRSENPFSFL